MEVTLNGRVSAKQQPALFRFLEPLDLRSIHGRSMLALLVEKAISLNGDDKMRYASFFMAFAGKEEHRKSAFRRFAVLLSEEDHPELMARLDGFGVDRVGHPQFIHLLEIAAGHFLAESGHFHQPQAHVPVAHKEEQIKQGPQAVQPSPPPPSSVKRIDAGASAVIASAANHGELADINAGDLDELFGVG